MATLTMMRSLVGACLAALISGCATAPRPVPMGNQPVATAEAAGVVVSVPRLDTGDYPGDMLDISAAVLVMIENRGQTEVQISPESFTLGAQGGQQYSPIPPQQLAYRTQPKDPAAELTGGADQLAWRGGGGISVRSAPSYSGFRGGGGVSVRPAPSYGGGGRPGAFVGAPRTGFSGGGYYGARSGFRGGYYGGGYGGYGGYGRPGFYYGRPWWWWSGPAYWGSSWGMSWYANPYYWDGPRDYAWSRADAIRLSLPAGKLPPGGRTGGFLYFPKVDHPDGAPMTLSWQVRDAASQQVIGEVQLPLEQSGD